MRTRRIYGMLHSTHYKPKQRLEQTTRSTLERVRHSAAVIIDLSGLEPFTDHVGRFVTSYSHSTPQA